MKGDLTQKVSFDIIRYANCWEDADVLLHGLGAQPGSNILSIAAAGDNSFSLLTTYPKKVIAVDISKPQLHLVSLKKQAIAHLNYEEVLCFLGFKNCDNRIAIFQKLKYALNSDERYYWSRNLKIIEDGIVFNGRFEKYFQLFVKKIMPWVHSKKDVRRLLSEKTLNEQIDYYNNHWNTLRWRLFFKIFFSKFIMGRLGRDPQFLKEVRVHVGDFIFEKAAKHLQTQAAQRNFILHYNLTASFGNLLPHYLQPENFEIIKENIDRLEIKEGFAEDVAETEIFDGMNLSNIFEYMDQNTFEIVAQKLTRSIKRGAKMVYWNLMVPRRLSNILPNQLKYIKGLSEQLTKQDKGFFYNCFNIDERR